MFNSYGFIAYGLLGASLMAMSSPFSCTPCKDFKESLSTEQEEIYKTVSKSRLTNFMVGLLIGIILAIIYYFMCKNRDPLIFISIILGIQYFYYIFAPKKYMLPYLTNDDQIGKYLAVGQLMTFRYHLGFALGILFNSVGMIYLCQK